MAEDTRDEVARGFNVLLAQVDGAPLAIPFAFLLAIPVFRSGAVYQVPARLRYRVRDAGVTWSFNLYRPERCLDDAFREACERAQKETSLSLFLGSPEEA